MDSVLYLSDRVMLHNPDWPETWYLLHAGLLTQDLAASASQVVKSVMRNHIWLFEILFLLFKKKLIIYLSKSILYGICL